MARILIITNAFRGHVNPIQAVADRLIRSGHQVIWMGRAISTENVAPTVPGVEIRDIDWEWLPPGGSLDFAGAGRDFESYVAFGRAWRVDSLEPLVPRLRRAIRECAPDLIATDAQMYPGIIAATQEGVPFVSLVTTPAFMLLEEAACSLSVALERLREPIHDAFRRHGLEPRFVSWEFLSPLESYVFALPELVGPERPLPPRTHLVGTSIAFDRSDDPIEYPWERIDADAPLVYMSLGTLFYAQPNLFRTVARVCDRLGVQLAATIGGLADTAFADELPPAVIATRYTPQLAMLERADVCVTHGGANTMMESIYYGVPQLVVPLCTDQPVNAYMIEAAGIGLAIPPEALTEARCEAALSKLLEPGAPERLASSRMRDAYRRSDGAQVAADRIEALLRAP